MSSIGSFDNGQRVFAELFLHNIKIAFRNLLQNLQLDRIVINLKIILYENFSSPMDEANR